MVLAVKDLPEPPAPLRFLELATRPLEANPELRQVAWADLARRIEASSVTTDTGLEQAAARLEAADRSTRRKWFMPLVGMVASLSLAVVTASTAYRFIQFGGFTGMTMPLAPVDEGAGPDRLAKKLSPNVRLLLFGNIDTDDEAEKWKQLWESDRSNPAFLQVYAEGCLRENDEIPPDVLKQVEAIDPENAYLPTLAAGSLAKGSFERNSGARSGHNPSEASKWIINDQTRFDQAFDAFRKAAELPEFTDHNIALNQQRFRHLPQGRDFLERISILTYTAQLTTSRVRLRALSEMLAAKAATLTETGDIAEFQECVRLWRWLVERSAESSWTLIDGLIARAIIQPPLKNFRDAADRLGLDDASRDFRMLDERMDLEKKERKTPERKDSSPYHLIETKGSIMASLTMPMVSKQVHSPPAFSEQDLKPGRMTDHALLGQAHATLAGLCFVLLMLVALIFRTVAPHDIRAVSRRLADLISPHDAMFLLVSGALFPVGLYVVLIQFPNLSAREWAMRPSGFLAPAGQLAALTLLMINLTIALGAMVTRKRLQMLAPARRSWLRFLPWFGVACAVCAMVACGISFGRGPALCGYGVIMLIPAAGWPLVFLLGRIFRKSNEPDLRLAVLHGFLAPVWGGATILCCLAFVFHRYEEIKWTGRDRLTSPDSEVRGLSHFEGQIAKQLSTEMQMFIKDLPQP